MTKRTPTPAQRARRTATVTKWLALFGAVPVALVSLWVSYGHIHDVTLAAGETPETARIMALSVDGMMLVAAIGIMAGVKSKIPYVAFAAGLAASLAANIISASGTIPSYIVAGWPAVALTLTGELMLRLLVPAKPSKTWAQKRAAKQAAARRAQNRKAETTTTRPNLRAVAS